MKISTRWQGKMRFETTLPGGTSAAMDAPAPIGDGSAPSPKQLLLAAICGCTGIDISARMRKLRLDLKGLTIEAEAPKREGKPATFDSVLLDFYFEGGLEDAAAVEAVVASQTEECGVSAMVAAHCPIRWRVHVNGRFVQEGEARFFGR